jgi:hypothetical protein
MINKFFFTFRITFLISFFTRLREEAAREDRAISAQARDVITNLGRFWHHQAPAVTCFLSPMGALLATSQNTKTVLILIFFLASSFSNHSILEFFIHIVSSQI